MKISRRQLTRVVALGAVVVALWIVQQFETASLDGRPATSDTAAEYPADGLAPAERAFRNQQSDVFLTAEGRVERILSDDNNPPRHQRFIVALESGHTILVAHNIDLAPRVRGLERGKPITVHGEYEWNPEGGVIHWTHHDPRGQQPGGWVEYANERYR